MNLIEHYNKLYTNSIQEIKLDSYQIDELIDSAIDNRFGITLLLRPDNNVKEEIKKFLFNIRMIEPNQYFYPESDLHVTILSIISCYHGFSITRIRIEDYIKIIHDSINGIGSFNIEFRGITASSSCLMIQGFLNDNTLNQIRNNLRINFRDSDLEQSIDKRYSIQTAHSTILRLKEKLNNKDGFLKILEAYRDYNFGSFPVNSIELVFNDWYQRKEFVEILYKFELK
jgi:2'-5' RNA ligase